jgi:ribosome-associated translation inhibitor RaiA
MRLHIEGKHTRLAPHLLGWVAERLEELNTPEEDIFEARVTFERRKQQDTAHIQLLLAGKTLRVTQRGATLEAAANAAIHMVKRALQNVRAARQQPGAAAHRKQMIWRSFLPPTVNKA